MENTKKLLLVDPKLYRPSMRDKTLSRLDEEIEQTLNADCADDEKAIRYLASLKKYRHYDMENKSREDSKSPVESEVLHTIPSEKRYKAQRILDQLKRNRDVQVGEEGEFIYKQQKLHGSRIADLVGDVLQKKSYAESPVGWREFANSLREAKVPRDLVVNTNTWNYMHPKVVDEDIKRRRRRQSSIEETPIVDSKRKSNRKASQKKTWIEF
jgi:hypothetical protein